MVAVFADGDYGPGATFRDANDRVLWERTFATGTDGMKKMAAAAILADPATPADEIRQATTPPLPAYSGLVKASPTIDDVLSVGPQGYSPGRLYDRAPTDFSGTPAGRDGTSVPSMSAY
jgi:hypothetical protein